jgi:1-acyl-sn-glycerol-3-phosphate acyltransferase
MSTDRGDRLPASWNTAPPRRTVGEFLTETVRDVRDITAGRRWEQTPGLPEPPADGTSRLPVRAARRALHAVALKPLLHAGVRLDVGGIEEVTGLAGPAVIVANHASRLDPALLLEALPVELRMRTGIAAGSGVDLVEAVWRAGDSAAEVLRAGWSVVVFGEDVPSADGYPGEFRAAGAELAIEHRVPVLPVGIRGSFAAVPRGRAWRRRGRTRVSVRFGGPLSARADESAAAFTERIAGAVRQLIVEDETTWWQSRRAAVPSHGRSEPPPPGSWRRIWEQSQSPEAGGQVKRPKIWR